MITEEAIIDLLPQFTLCKNYADRLAFWDKYDLTERLYYDIPSDFKFLYPVSTFTIAPFSEDEAHQFVDWALRVRPVMPGAPLSAQKLCLDFQNRYYSIGRKADREEYLQECQNNVGLLIKDRNWSNLAQRSMILDERRLSPTLYAQFFAGLRGAFKPNLIDCICVGDTELDWEVIDTYLYTDAQYKYAVFLENFSPDDHKPEQMNSGTDPVGDHLKPVQIASVTTPTSFVDLFEPGSDPDKCIEVLRRLDSPVINANGSWIGRRGSKSILVAWIDCLIASGKLKPVTNDKQLAQLLNAKFPGLNLGRDARSFTQRSGNYEQYKNALTALITFLQ